MFKLKNGKEEIVYLLTNVVQKFQQETGAEIVLNTNRKNYQSLAILLSDISNQLPEKYKIWDTDAYESRERDKELQYPYRKYDITGGQIKDALNGIVSNPRPFLVDACYIYLYGIGRKGFEKNPSDDNLIAQDEDITYTGNSHIKNDPPLQDKIEMVEINTTAFRKKLALVSGLAILLAVALLSTFLWGRKTKRAFVQLKQDMTLLPYQPTQQEIDSLEGIWICYTGSPQARGSYEERFHKVVSNLVDIKYKHGYFVFDRYGASFDHTGYMQFEAPGIVSIYSRIANKTGNVESPRHSLMNLNSGKDYIPVISASWNFDSGNYNKIVGIREVYKKVGKGGRLHEIINQVENASCQCKIVNWLKDDKTTEMFYLKNQDLSSIFPKEIQPLINENSILLNEPDSALILKYPIEKRVK